MLIRFRVENFQSIRDEQALSLVASPLSERQETLVHSDRYQFDLLRSAAVYGPNASGKSTIFYALRFMKAAVEKSHRQWPPEGGVPRTPFALNPASPLSPSLFAVDLLLEGVRYEYGFVVDSSRVLEEWLHAYPKGRRQEWFSRQADEFSFSRLLPGENRTISSFTRPNSLFLSTAAQNNHSALAPVYRWFSSRLAFFDDETRSVTAVAVAQLCMSDRLRASMEDLLRAADVGVTAIELIEEDVPTFAGRYNLRLDDPEVQELFPFSPRVAAGVQLRHRAGPGNADAVLPFDQESQGTRALFALAGLMLSVLQTAGVLVVDELDRSLHPHLALKIIELFQNPATNPQAAQLIFNTHDTNLLDAGLMRRDQVWFTEKGDDGATRLFPLTDFRARKSENLERGYLQGRYGAVPSIRTPDFLQHVGG